MFYDKIRHNDPSMGIWISSQGSILIWVGIFLLIIISNKAVKITLSSLFDDGYNVELKKRIECWLEEEDYLFSSFPEPNDYFHFVLNDIGQLKITVDIFQENNSDDVIIGSMTFLSHDIIEKISKYDEIQLATLKKNLDEFLTSLKTDYRIGYRIGHDVINDNGHYGLKYFIKTNVKEFTRNKLLTAIRLNVDVANKIDELLRAEFFSKNS